jgi:hypothetical protein
MVVFSRLIASSFIGTVALLAPGDELAKKVLQFAERQLGNQVGHGECAELAAAAVKAAGGQSYFKLGRSDLNADYVWGKLIVTLTPKDASAADIKPGDIIQFRDVQLLKQSKITQTGGPTRTQSSTTTFPHHTAIVRAVNGDFIEIIHQNHGGVRTVDTKTIWVGSPKSTETSGTTTTESQHSFASGTMWVYRVRR